METDTEESVTPPTPERVAARAIVLSAVSCRAFIERDAVKPGAEQLRLDVLSWLERIGVSAELEQREATLLSIPLGNLDRETMLESMWRCEGMAVLGWVLGRVELPQFYSECDPTDVANALGFLADRQATVLHQPQIRDVTEVRAFEETYLTLHWRLRQFSIEPSLMDFPAYMSSCNWATLRLDKVDLCDGDLAINGTRIDRVEPAFLRKSLSIVQERHRAFNWLIGWDSIYSEVTTDT